MVTCSVSLYEVFSPTAKHALLEHAFFARFGLTRSLFFVCLILGAVLVEFKFHVSGTMWAS